jgi:large subunit ribosomal protein L23
MRQTLKKPLLTEKNTAMQEYGTYCFEVDRRATKIDVKISVEKAFRVKVKSVQTMVCRNRRRKTGRSLSNLRYWKKAMVRLAAGEKIQLFEGV